MGLVYSTAFLFATPIFLWRYGVLRTIATIAVPVAAAISIPALAGGIGLGASTDYLVGAVPFGLLVAAGGYWVSRNDARIVLVRYQANGWTLLARVSAQSGRAAIAAVRLPKTNEKVNWLRRLANRLGRHSGI